MTVSQSTEANIYRLIEVLQAACVKCQPEIPGVKPASALSHVAEPKSRILTIVKEIPRPQKSIHREAPACHDSTVPAAATIENESTKAASPAAQHLLSRLEAVSSTEQVIPVFVAPAQVQRLPVCEQNAGSHENIRRRDPLGGVQCPYCYRAKQQVKAGKHESGTQRYLCKCCQRRYTPDPARFYGDEMRQQAVRWHRDGLSFRQIGRQLGTDHATVMNWVKNIPANTIIANANAASPPHR